MPGGATTTTWASDDDGTDPTDEGVAGNEWLLVTAAATFGISPLLAVLLLLLYLLSMLLESDDDETRAADPDLAPEERVQADGAGSEVGDVVDAVPGQDHPTTGARMYDPVQLQLRFVNRLAPRVLTDYPPPDGALSEYPHWWDFAGRWGVRMAPSADRWHHGSRRVDRYGRSLGYWNTVAFVRAWSTLPFANLPTGPSN